MTGQQRAHRGAGDRIPEPHRVVPAAGGQQSPTVRVGAERHRLHRAACRSVARPPRPGERIPQPHRAVPPPPEASRVRPSAPVPNATASTGPVWPVSGSPTGLPVASPTAAPCRPRRRRPAGSGRRRWRRTPPLHPVGVAGQRLADAAPVAGSHSRTVPSSPPEASRVRPSGLRRTPPTTPSRCGRSAARPPARRWPGPTAAPCRPRRRRPAASGRRADAERHRDTPPVWPVSGSPTGGSRCPDPTAAPCRPRRRKPAVCGRRSCAERHRCTGPYGRSAAAHRGCRCRGPTAAPCRPRRRRPAGSGRPAGAERHRLTGPVWPVSGSPTGAPVAGSHSRTVPSSPPEASRPLSGSAPNATAESPSPCGPSAVARRGAGGRVPQPHRAVLAAGGQQGPAVGAGAECH